jgi:hypothetical protein
VTVAVQSARAATVVAAEQGAVSEMRIKVRDLEARAQSAYADGLAAGRAENAAQGMALSRR